jgi:hypothetical protein
LFKSRLPFLLPSDHGRKHALHFLSDTLFKARKMMMNVLCHKNRANGLRTAIKTHGTLFVHQRKGKLSFTAPSVPLTVHVLTEAKVMLLVMFGLLIKVFIEDSSALLLLGQCGFWFQHDDEHHFCLREHMHSQWHRRRGTSS